MFSQNHPEINSDDWTITKKDYQDNKTWKFLENENFESW